MQNPNMARRSGVATPAARGNDGLGELALLALSGLTFWLIMLIQRIGPDTLTLMLL